MYFLLNLSHYVKSYGHLCEIFAKGCGISHRGCYVDTMFHMVGVIDMVGMVIKLNT